MTYLRNGGFTLEQCSFSYLDYWSLSLQSSCASFFRKFFFSYDICRLLYADYIIGNDVVPPYKGFRLKLFRAALKLYSRIHLSFVFGISVNHLDVDYDYSYYLGPNYKEIQKKYTHPSTVVANHSNSHDLFLLSSRYTPRFIGSRVADLPVLGYLARVC